MTNEEVFDAIGVITSKEEASTAADKGGKLYWKFKIQLDGHQNPLSFAAWEHAAGVNVSVGDQCKVIWIEKDGSGVYGQVTYRNIKSIEKLPVGGGASGGQSPTPPASAPVQRQAPQSSTGLTEDQKRQQKIIRQNCLGHATNMVIAMLKYRVQRNPGFNYSDENIIKDVKDAAEELENWVNR